MVCSRPTVPSWLSAASRVDFDGGASAAMPEAVFLDGRDQSNSLSDFDMGFSERVLSATGAAFLSAIIVNPLDVAKAFVIPLQTRLQAQAAGVPYSYPQHHISRCMASLGPNMIFPDVRCSPSCTHGGLLGTGSFCPPECSQYKGTMDVFYKIIRQEGFARLWRGTNAGLALAIPTLDLEAYDIAMVRGHQSSSKQVLQEEEGDQEESHIGLFVVGIYLPCYDIFRNWIEEFTTQYSPKLTPYAPLVAGSVARSLACVACSPIELARTRMQAYKEFQVGGKPPGMWKTLLDVLSSVRSTNNHQNMYSYRVLWTGVGAQLARDVPYSAICWSTLEPIRRRLLRLVGEDANAASVVGANFTAGFVAGSLAAAATCPLDVAKTRRQIQKDPAKTWRMTTKQTLIDVWRDGGMKGLFTGIGPRVARAGPSVGIVVSFYEVVKYALHQRHTSS
ncbi:mitochondrial carrier protein MTM1 isoform X1 [Cinnamomum micranthum f. kanehirae]|uniref:Mitochondrial carrier protein MTM1 isoform X1 n=2 Tax=Magnoliopsida TaxID=3398 RepID=A0A3S3MAZ9_9MAGN|nr:mitochondrial carrier protein MTM1 isoform X1 [Cinnamomum micranthum f. kanehirae]